MTENNTTVAAETKKAPKARKPKVEVKTGPGYINGRKIVYDEPVASMCVGDNALTVEQAKVLIGWTEDAEEARLAGIKEPTFKDMTETAIYLMNNVHNRPFYATNMDKLAQKILRRQWRYNGEPIIVGETGLVHNGQHQLVALIIADQRRLIEGDGKAWANNWPGPCTIEKMVVYGIKEQEDVINTMDTCLPRSLEDVIYRCKYFEKVEKSKDRYVLSKMLSGAIKLMWNRTGAANAFAPRRNHEESIDWVNRHPRLLRAVKHVFDEYTARSPKGNEAPGKPPMGVSRWQGASAILNAGYSAALLYLMAASETDQARYKGVGQRKSYVPNEKMVDFTNWDKATTFWSELCGSLDKPVDEYDGWFLPVRDAIALCCDAAIGAGGNAHERMAILVRAWTLFVEGKDCTTEDLLDLENDYIISKVTKARRFNVCPTVGGIDQGAADFVPSDGHDPDEDTVAKAKEIIKQKNMEEMRDDHKESGEDEDGMEPTESEVGDEEERDEADPDAEVTDLSKVNGQRKAPPRPRKRLS